MSGQHQESELSVIERLEITLGESDEALQLLKENEELLKVVEGNGSAVLLIATLQEMILFSESPAFLTLEEEAQSSYLQSYIDIARAAQIHSKFALETTLRDNL